MKRILSLVAAVVVLTTSVTFAQSPMQPNFCGKMKRHSHNEKIMGSVKSVDKDNSSFIVVNSDSVDIKVVINPKTRIIQLPKERPQIGDRPQRNRSQEGDRPQRDRSQEGDRPRRDRSHWGMNMVERPTPPPQLSLEDISVGDWVQVSVYESDTVAKDAIHVQVFKKN